MTDGYIVRTKKSHLYQNHRLRFRITTSAIFMILYKFDIMTIYSLNLLPITNLLRFYFKCVCSQPSTSHHLIYSNIDDYEINLKYVT